MDWGKTNGDTKRMLVGSGCSKGGKPCNLIEFVEFINYWPDGIVKPIDLKDKPAGWDPLDMKPEHVDWAAKALKDAGATGVYEPNKIWKGVKRNDVDGLFRKVGLYIKDAQNAGGVPPNAVACAKKAVSVWADLRTFAMRLAFLDHLEIKYPAAKPLPRITVPVGNSGATVQTADGTLFEDKIQKLPNMADYNHKADLKKFAADDTGHSDKVRLANTIKASLEC